MVVALNPRIYRKIFHLSHLIQSNMIMELQMYHAFMYINSQGTRSQLHVGLTHAHRNQRGDLSTTGDYPT